MQTSNKKIIAYVNTTRIHWLVEEIQNLGISEIMVTEYFRPNCQISRIEFLCDKNKIENIRTTIHKIGTCGNSADHFWEVQEVEENIKSIFPFV